jgi:thiamine-monophosphate kinase
MIVEGVDFSLDDKPYFYRRKAIAISLSDIASCLGSPTHCLVSIGIPKNTPLRFVNSLFRGCGISARNLRLISLAEI